MVVRVSGGSIVTFEVRSGSGLGFRVVELSGLWWLPRAAGKILFVNFNVTPKGQKCDVNI